MIVEFLEERKESDEVSAFDFELKRLDSPEDVAKAIPEKIDALLLESYGKNDQFASSTEIVGMNPKLKTLVLSVRIKCESVPSEVIQKIIEKTAQSLH